MARPLLFRSDEFIKFDEFTEKLRSIHTSVNVFVCVCVCVKLQHLYEDIASNVKNGFYTHSLCLKVHSHERQRLHLRVRLRQDDNIVSMRMLRQTQRMGVEPILLCI